MKNLTGLSNVGFTIIAERKTTLNEKIVLGFRCNPDKYSNIAAEYVTWHAMVETEFVSYFYGHYENDFMKATNDYFNRD